MMSCEGYEDVMIYDFYEGMGNWAGVGRLR